MRHQVILIATQYLTACLELATLLLTGGAGKLSKTNGVAGCGWKAVAEPKMQLIRAMGATLDWRAP